MIHEHCNTLLLEAWLITKVWEFFLGNLRIFLIKFMNFITFYSEKNFRFSRVCLFRSLSCQEFVFQEFQFQEFVFQEFVMAPFHLSFLVLLSFRAINRIRNLNLSLLIVQAKTGWPYLGFLNLSMSILFWFSKARK